MRTRYLAVPACSLLVLPVLAVPALAATAPALLSSTPAKAAQVKTLPSAISATFDSNLGATSTFSVAGPSGTLGFSCTSSAPSGKTLSCSPNSTGAVAQGLYTVTYNAASTDTPPATTGSQSYSFTVDSTAPVAPTALAFTPATYTSADNGQQVVVTGKSESGTDTVAVSLAVGSSSVSKAATVASDGSFSASFDPPADGTMTATATSTDAAGNTGPAATKTAVKDTTGPTYTTSPVDGGAEQPRTGTTNNGYSITAGETLDTASATSKTVVKLYDSTDTEVAVTKTVTGNTKVTLVPTAPLVDGGHYTGRGTLVDVYGNSTAFSTSFTVDSQAPKTPAINAPGPINGASATRYVVTGTGEPGATLSLTLTDGATPAATKTVTTPVASDGTWTATVDASSLADGTVKLSATQTDAAGNASATPATATTTKDTVTPTATAAFETPTTYNSSKTSATVTVSVRNGATPVDAAEAGDTVAVSVTDSAGKTVAGVATTPTGSGTYTFSVDISGLSGTLTATATATDPAGNTSAPAKATATRDTGVPTTPAVTAKVINAANAGAYTVSGKADAGTTITVTLTDSSSPAKTVTGTATVASDGTFTTGSINASSLADGPVTVSAYATRTAGNQSPTATTSTTKDTVAPTAPTLTDPATVNAATAKAAPFSGTTGEAGTITVTVKDGGTPAKSVTGTVTAGSDGKYSGTIDVSSLADGTLTWTATNTDAAGNPSPAGTGSPASTKDTVAPSAPATVTASPATFTSRTTTAETVSGTTATGDTGSGETATYTLTDAAKHVVKGTSSVTAGPTGGSFTSSYDANALQGLDDGTVTVSVTLTDAAGNTGPATTATFLKDTTKIALTSSTPADGSDVSKPASASVTFNETLSTSGTGTTSTVVLTNSAGTVVAGTSAYSADSRTMTFTPSSPLSDQGSNYTLTYTAYDSRDTGDKTTGSVSFKVDSTPPVAPTVSTVTSPVNSASAAKVTATGGATEKTGLKVVVTFASGGQSVTATTTSGSDGSWSVGGVDLTPLPDGTVTVTAVSTDAAGNASPASAPVTTTKDTVAAALKSASPANGSTVKPPTSVVLTFTEPLVDPSTVSLTASSGAAVQGSSSINGTTLTFTPTTPLADDTYTASATTTDAAGNPGTATSSFTTDGTGPATTGLSATPTSKGAQSSTVTGTTEPGATVAVSATVGGKTATATATADTSGAFNATLDLTGFPDGSVPVSATASDTLGNAGPAAMTSSARDTTGPVVTGLAATATSAGTPSTTVSGSTGEAGDTVSITVGTLAPVSVTTGSGGAFSTTVDASSLKDGSITVSATATDTAPPVANTGGTAQTTFSKDATAPVVSDLKASASTTSTPTSTVTGTRSESSTVHVTWTDVNGTVLTADVAAGTGSFSTSKDLSAFAVGGVTVTAVATDTAGNTGPTAMTTTMRSMTTAPSTPGTPSATARDASATVSFAAPSSDGGATVTGYTVTSSPAGGTATGSSSPLTVTGLTNGTAYTFTVTAHNSAGDSAPSTSSNSVTPMGSSTLTLASPATSTSGQAIALTGTVTRTDTTVTPGTVTISVRTDDGVTKVVGTVRPATSGAYSLRTAPTVNGTYTAVYNGDSHVTGRTSAAHRTVVGTAVRVTSPASGARGAHTTPLVVKGTVSPNKAGKVVTLYQVLAGGKLKALGTAKVAGNGTWTISVKLPKANYTLQVGIAATTGNGAGTSVRFTSGRT